MSLEEIAAQVSLAKGDPFYAKATDVLDLLLPNTGQSKQSLQQITTDVLKEITARRSSVLIDFDDDEKWQQMTVDMGFLRQK